MLPAKLYRIQHAKSRATFDEEGDLVAKLVFYTPHAVQQWRDCLAAHLQWNEVGTDSPLLSTFDSAWRALEWGEVLARHRLPGEQHVVLYEIDTAKLGDTAVFHAKSSLLGLAMKPPSRLTDHEYLLLHRVPTQAIRVVQNVSNPLFHEPKIPRLEYDGRNLQQCLNPEHRILCLTCLGRTVLGNHLERQSIKEAKGRSRHFPATG